MKIYFEENCLIKDDVLNLIKKLEHNETLSVFTSGTTGSPKPINKNISTILEHKRKGLETDRWLLTFDPNRWSGISVITHILNSESCLYVPKTLAYKDIISCGYKNNTTHLSITPSLFKTIILNDFEDFFKKISFQQITFGGEVSKQSILTVAKNIFPQARITHVYASTETGDICAISDGLEGIPKEKFKNFAFNENKELIVKGINTQDIWSLNGDRYYFEGRIQEIINVGGIKVSPIKVEEAAVCSGAMMAKAYSVKNPILGNLVGLDYVGDITEIELKKNLKTKLSRYELPSKINKVLEIPLTPSGKITRIEKTI